ncbi:hypothetical protein [Oceanobacillus salinisoli]|uniref:hypothetical protein n=1 Tax=Oceanobacillus salinisoli TaxID=2678611 RepID=UPI0012E1935C|nr:hypothetical protein [Oceanobacillus salinisoli]
MEIPKISLMEAYMIETLRSKGVTDQELIEGEDISAWNRLHESFDFQDLLRLREKDPIAFQTMVEEGYQVKFVTFNGLKNLLKLKFNKMDEVDYQTTESGIRGLYLNTEERHQLTSLLSKNWTVHEEELGDKPILHIELV